MKKTCLLICFFTISVLGLETPLLLESTISDTNRIRLLWRDNSIEENGFIIFRSHDSVGSFFVLDTVGQNTNTYYDISAHSAQTYYYKLLAFNLTEISDTSNTLSATTGHYVPPLPVLLPPRLTALSLDTLTATVRLSFKDYSNVEEKYTVLRKNKNGWVEQGVIDVMVPIETGDTIDYIDTSTDNYTLYCYKIKLTYQDTVIFSDSSWIFTYAFPSFDTITFEPVSVFSTKILSWAELIGDTLFIQEDLGSKVSLIGLANLEYPVFLGFASDTLLKKYATNSAIFQHTQYYNMNCCIDADEYLEKRLYHGGAYILVSGRWDSVDDWTDLRALTYDKTSDAFVKSQRYRGGVFEGPVEVSNIVKNKDSVIFYTYSWYIGNSQYLHGTGLHGGSFGYDFSEEMGWGGLGKDIFLDSNLFLISYGNGIRIYDTELWQTLADVQTKGTVVYFNYPYLFELIDSNKLEVFDVFDFKGMSRGGITTVESINKVIFNPTNDDVIIIQQNRTDIFHLSINIHNPTRLANSRESTNESNVKIFPNPFNPVINISYSGQTDPVEMAIYTITGSLVKTFRARKKAQVVWDASGYASGLYILKVRDGNNQHTRKLMLQR